MCRERPSLPTGKRLSPFRAFALGAAALALAGCGGQQPNMSGRIVPPTGVHVVADDGKLTIYWDKQPQANSYNLYWSTSPKPKTTTATKVDGITDTSYSQSGLTNGQDVYYLLTAVNTTGETKPTAFQAKPFKTSVMRFPQHLAVIAQPTDTYAWLAQHYLGDATKAGLIQDYNEREPNPPTPYAALTIPLQPWKIGGVDTSGFQVVPVLTYHQFTTGASTNRMVVTASAFEAQMKYLKDNDYRVVPLNQFIDFVEFKGQIPDRSVVITIDDGWRSFYDIAYPILKKYGYPSTLFIITDFPDDPKAKAKDGSPLALSWPQIQDMSKNGVDIECHTKTHRDLRMQPDEDFRAYLKALDTELVTDQSELKRKSGITCHYLAYPYGGRNSLVDALTQKAGYRAAFTVKRGSDPFFIQDFQIQRSMIYGDWGIEQFKKNLKTQIDLKP